MVVPDLAAHHSPLNQNVTRSTTCHDRGAPSVELPVPTQTALEGILTEEFIRSLPPNGRTPLPQTR